MAVDEDEGDKALPVIDRQKGIDALLADVERMIRERPAELPSNMNAEQRKLRRLRDELTTMLRDHPDEALFDMARKMVRYVMAEIDRRGLSLTLRSEDFGPGGSE